MCSSASSYELLAAAVTGNGDLALALRDTERRLALRTAEKFVCFSLLKIQLSALEKSDKCHVFHLSLGKIARHNAEISVDKNKNSQIIHDHMRDLIRNPTARKHCENGRPNQRVGQRIESVSACHKCHESILHEISPQTTCLYVVFIVSYHIRAKSNKSACFCKQFMKPVAKLQPASQMRQY